MTAIEKARDWIAWLGVTLGVIALAVSLHVNQLSNDRTASTLTEFRSSSCQRQHDAAKQWDSVITVLKDLAEKQAPGSSHSPQFEEFKRRTAAIYNTFPACSTGK